MRRSLDQLQEKSRDSADRPSISQSCGILVNETDFRKLGDYLNCPAFCFASESLLKELRISSMIHDRCSSWKAKTYDGSLVAVVIG